MKPIERLSIGLLLTVAAAGCTRWQYTYPLPAPGEAPRTFDAGRVTTVGSGMVVLRDVVVTADSVIGWQGETEAQRQRIAVHRSQVLVFDRRVTDHWRTGSAFLLGVATIWAALAVYFLATVQV